MANEPQGWEKITQQEKKTHKNAKARNVFNSVPGTILFCIVLVVVVALVLFLIFDNI